MDSYWQNILSINKIKMSFSASILQMIIQNASSNKILQ